MQYAEQGPQWTFYGICEIYIDDVLIHGKSEEELLRDVRQVFERLRATNIAVKLYRIVSIVVIIH